jgi:putative endonuclease
MRNERQQRGDLGEDLAVRHLKKQGYRILEKNYRGKRGEIDIIANDRDTLVFIEVKTRGVNRFGPAKEAVTLSKKRRLSILALDYLKETRQHGKKARFDVVAINMGQGRTEIEIIRNAFDLVFP